MENECDPDEYKCSRISDSDDEWIIARKDDPSRAYLVNTSENTCSCKDSTINKHTCKHLRMVRKELTNMEGSKEIKVRKEISEGDAIRNIVRDEIPFIPEVDQAYRYHLPRQGKIHLGEKVIAKSGKEFPQARDYFVLPDQLLEDSDFQAALEALGEDPSKPKTLPIWFPSDVIAVNLQSSADYYGSSRGLICRSLDGITCRYVDAATGELKENPCSMRSGCEHYEKGDCHWIHRLRFFLPDSHGTGVWQIDTTSKNSRPTLATEMKIIKGILGGRLAGIDLLLQLKPQEFSLVIDGKPAKVTKWLLHIDSAKTFRELMGATPRIQSLESAEIEDFDLSQDDSMPLPVDEESEEIPDSDMADAIEEPLEAEVIITDDNKQTTLEDAIKAELITSCSQIVARRKIPIAVSKKMVQKVSIHRVDKVHKLNVKELMNLKDMMDNWDGKEIPE